MKRNIILGFTTMLLVVVASLFFGRVSAQRESDRKTAARIVNTTPQPLPFTQNWTNTGLITVNDDWSGVPGIVGYLGDDPAGSVPDVDPRTITVDNTTVDVNANQTNPDTFASGGVTEFEITNPVVAFQGSGTSDFGNIVIYIDTTGQSGVQVAFNARDIDSASEVVQQLNVQYRVGTSGAFANVTGGYFADVSAAGATQVTPVSVTLPAAADNQPNVQIRIMTTNATGSDEFIGIDDISITAGGGGTPGDAPSDFNGDGKTDFAVVRNAGGANGQLSWFIQLNGGAELDRIPFGRATDSITPGDFDGDGSDDIAIWRPANDGSSGFYILQSSNGAVRYHQLGLGEGGDDPFVVTDYDGDGADDPAIYRPGATSGEQSTFWFIPSGGPNAGIQTPVNWGLGSDDPVPGDFTGDGKADFMVRRSTNCGSPPTSCGIFYMHPGTGGDDVPGADTTTFFGRGNDLIVPGKYDGDDITDIALVRDQNTGGVMLWFILASTDGLSQQQFGLSGDTPVQGDYDGDGHIDIAVWRANPDPTQNYFYWNGSDTGLGQIEWGQCPFGNCDVPTASDNTHGL